MGEIIFGVIIVVIAAIVIIALKRTRHASVMEELDKGYEENTTTTHDENVNLQLQKSSNSTTEHIRDEPAEEVIEETPASTETFTDNNEVEKAPEVPEVVAEEPKVEEVPAKVEQPAEEVPVKVKKVRKPRKKKTNGQAEKTDGGVTSTSEKDN